MWVEREIDAPADQVWELLTDPAVWPEWGPTVQSAAVDGGELALGATGTVRTPLGLELPFEITEFDPPRSWSWKVARVPATSHRVVPLGEDRCRAGFSIWWAGAPYLAVCRVALGRIERLATA
ncbi:MAG: SRPBCC family protein [Ilumatobacter sp.]|nr:SRPBCC family protein [Ilumatobacter sp.]